jgi:ABC-type lipoprotein release transport system permease subunit
MAALLELARIYKAHPPKRTVWFVACGAHFLGLQGARTYVDQHIEDWQDASGWDHFVHSVSFGHTPLPTGRQDIRIFSGLDLSSGSSGVGVFYKGYFYNYREDINGDFSDIGRTMRENAGKIGGVLGFDADSQFADGINGVNGKSWRNYLPGHFAFDAEVATLAGGRGIALATTNDGRPLSDTPSDTVDHVDIANLTQQTKVLACEYWDLFNDTDNADSLPQNSPKGIMPVSTWVPWTREGLRLGMTELTGRVLQFDPIKNFVPDKPIVDSLAVICNPSKTMVSVRGNLVTEVYSNTSKPDAEYKFVGLPLITAQPQGLINTVDQTTGLQAYHVLASSGASGSRGDIDFAPDQQSAYNVPIQLTTTTKDTQIIVFACVETAIYDLIDQQALKTLDGVNILDGASNSNPREYGFLLAQAEPGVSYAEDVAVLFSTPGSATRLKVLMSSGPDTRFLLINSLPIDPKKTNAENQRDAQGVGYAVGSPSALEANYSKPPDPNDPNDVVRAGTITDTDYRVARDMWNLDEFRIQQLAQFRIVDDNVHNSKGTGLHDIAASYIQKALEAYNSKDYNAFDSYSRAAWGFEARVYPQVQNTANDVIKGVVFYLFLLIPFAFFLERLLVGSSDLRGQLGWSFGIFVVVFLIFSSVHPAFKITVNPMMVLIAFVMLALSVFVSLLIWGKFEEQLNAISQTVTGVHKAEANKASIAFAAFALGISNMRRRKERTILTCITLVLLTFTVLSFTSVVNSIRTNDVAAPGVSAYNGILIRLPNWDALQEPAYRIISDAYGRQYPVAPRSWYFGTDQGQQTFLSVTRAELSTDIKGVVGMTPQEADVTHLDSALIAGRWLNPTDTYSVILPKPIADSLGIDLKATGRTTIVFTGVKYLVVGIYDPDKFKAVTDLDDENLTPVDYQASSQMQSSSSGSAAASSSAGFQQFTHLDPSNVIITPFKTVMNMGGGLRSIAINFGSASTTDSELRQLIKRLDLNIYAGEDGHNHRFSAIASTAPSGLVQIVIPILIAALIVLNTMLGSVFERVKEIAIFSSIGLSPSNISMLFIAEALVYGIIGAVSGYLIGQTLSKVISSLGVLQGLYLNFSSTSAEMSIFLVIAVVLLSTIFPARKASEVASPSVDRVWRLPEPVGDDWDITLPFAVTGSQATGVNNFLAEWFSSFEEQSVGDFLTNDIRTGSLETERGPGHVLTVRVWLAPFDLGVSQDVALKIVPTDLEGVFAVELHITRVSGDVSNWKRINRRFLNVVRRQFLIWRTLNELEQQKYQDPPPAQEAVGEPAATLA